MEITKHAVVTIDYELKDDDGKIIDTSAGSDPLQYLHGAMNIIEGLEKALDGKKQVTHFLSRSLLKKVMANEMMPGSSQSPKTALTTRV